MKVLKKLPSNKIDLSWLKIRQGKTTGVFITATDTEVGKTIVTGLIARQLKDQGMSVGVMKPVAAGARCRKGKLFSEDAVLLKKISGVKDSLELINPICLRRPLAPLVASSLEGKKIGLDKIWQAYRVLSEKYEIVLVEGIGGLLVPITEKFYAVDIAKKLDLSIIIVARPCLGTINHTLLTIDYLKKYGLKIEGVVFNYSVPSRKGTAERTNPDVITKQGKVKLLGIVPYNPVRGLDTK